MSALTANNAALLTRDGEKVMRLATSSVALFSGGFVMRDEDGLVRPLITGVAGEFEGIGGGEILAADTGMNRQVEVTRKGAFKATISGIAATDVGKPVWCITDNPADCTLSYTAGYHLVGHVLCLEYSSQGAISGKCWVMMDTTSNLIGLRSVPRGQLPGMRHIPGGIEYWNDFLESSAATVTKVAGTGCWLNTMVDGDGDAAEVIKLDDSAPDGQLGSVPNNKAVDANSLQLNGAPFTPGSTAVVYFETRVKIADITKGNVVIGMCARGGGKYAASGGGFFFRMDHDANIVAVSELNTTEDANDTTSDWANDTFVTLGILYELGASVKFYVNGVLKITTTDTSKIVTGVDLTPTFECICTDTTQVKLTIDYVLVRQMPRI